MLRLHPPPQHDDFAALERALSRQGIAFDARTSADLARSLAAARKPGDPDFNHVVRLMATRCIAPARYFRSGALPPEEWSHCGLAEPVYTHFTSPIRRYADQVTRSRRPGPKEGGGGSKWAGLYGYRRQGPSMGTGGRN